MAKPSGPHCVDGQLEAIRLLRSLERLNWDLYRDRKSAATLIDTMLESNTWPKRERERFARVISRWLVDAVLGCVPDLDAYERAIHAKAMRSDTGFQAFISRTASTVAAAGP